MRNAEAVISQGKFFLILGAFLGFGLTFFAGMLAGHEATIALRDAAIGCIAGFFLMKGFMHVVFSSLQSVIEKKHREREAQRQEARRAAAEAAAREEAEEKAEMEAAENPRRSRKPEPVAATASAES